MTTTPTALSGLRVVELGSFYSAAYCTKLLADLGAQVTKIEPPTGDIARRYGPFAPGTDDDPEAGGLHLYLDAGKRGAVLDIGTSYGRERLVEILAVSDALVTNLTPASLRGHRLDYPTLGALLPNLVYTSLSPFGSWGPYSDYLAHHLHTIATGGGCTIGEPDREPLQYPYWQGHVQTGAHGAAATLTALRAQPHVGGQWVDIAEADLWAYHIGGGAVHTWVFHGRARRRSGRSTPNFYPHGLFRCKDGHIAETAVRGAEWRRFLELMGGGQLPAWADDPKYRDRRRNAIEYAEELDAFQEPWLMAHTKEEIFAACQANRVPFAPVYTMDEVANCDHLADRNFFVTLATASGVEAAAPGSPYRLSATPARAGRPAPTLGQHTDVVLSEVAGSTGNRGGTGQRTEPERGQDGQDGHPAPLEGVRVLDFSAVIAGPVCTRFLADYGAEVIKIESMRHIDALRKSENNVDGDPEHDSMFHFMNRNKRSLRLNIATDEGRDIALALAEICDVSVENFSPRALRAQGLHAEALRARNPRLITLSLPAAGDHGRLKNMLAYGGVVAAVSGLDSVAGYPGEEPLGIQGVYCDWNSGIHGVVAILAALRHRDRTGEGQIINLAQWEAATAALGPAILEHTMAGMIAEPQGNTEPRMAPHNIYPARGEEQWVALGCASDAQWRALVEAMGSPAWATAAELETRAGRQAASALLDAQIAAWTRTQDRDQVVATLQASGVPATPVLDIAERFADPHFAAREAFVGVDHPTMGTVLLGGMPWKLSETPGRVRSAGPLMGQDNDDVLGRLLGIDADTRRELAAKGVLH